MLFSRNADVSVDIETTPRHSGYYMPGDVIRGNVVVESTSQVSTRGIFVELKGVCATSATEETRDIGCPRHTSYHNRCADCDNATSSSRTLWESIDFLLLDNQLFPPPEHVRQLNSKNPTLTLQSGKRTFEFEFKLPQYCMNRRSALSTGWVSALLPSSITLPDRSGTISYSIDATVQGSGFFSASPKGSQQFKLFQPSADPDTNRRRYAQQKALVEIYDISAAAESWGHFIKRAVGLPSPATTRDFMVRMEHPSNLVVKGPMKGLFSLTVKRLADEDKKGLEYSLAGIDMSIQYSYSTKAQSAINSNTKVVTITKKAFKHRPLVFEEGACILSDVFDTFEIPDEMLTAVCPNIQVYASLVVEVGIMPNAGAPIVPVWVSLKSPISLVPEWGLPAFSAEEAPPAYTDDIN